MGRENYFARKKDDYFTKRGHEALRRGMNENESKQRKISYLTLFAISFVLIVYIMGLHGERSNNAIKIND